VVCFKEAVCGLDAKATLSDIYDFNENRESYVSFLGTPIKIGVSFTVRGKKISPDYQIQPGDEIITVGTLTLEDLLVEMVEDYDAEQFTINGQIEPLHTVLHDGDIIDSAAASKNAQPSPSNAEPKSDVPPEEWGEIALTLNGASMTLPPTTDRTRHMILELLTFMDTTDVSGYTMYINQTPAGFNDVIKSGDEVVIELTQRQV